MCYNKDTIKKKEVFKMKKIICILLALVLIFGLCSCSTKSPEVPDSAEVIGYVIIPHSDGDEHADIYEWYTINGMVTAYCVDGRTIISPQIILVLNEKN